MAKKKSTEVIRQAHSRCIHCSAVKDEFLSNSGTPILGECLFSKYRFLLHELTDCKNFKGLKK